MTQPYSSFGVANTVEPLVTPSPNSLLQDADPAIFYALDFFTYVINTFPGPRLIAEAAGSGAPIAAAVVDSYPWQPLPEQLNTQLHLPLLAIYRTETEYKQLRAGWDTDLCKFEILYVLPPITAGQNEAIIPILRAVEASLRWKMHRGMDPGYTPKGGSAGQQPWSAPFAGVEELDFDRGFMGNIANAGNLWFPTLRIQGRFKERDTYVSTGVKFAGGDITVNETSADGSVIPAFVQVSTQQAPTVSSLSVTTGTHNGGTNLTITGTLFLTGPPVVMFGITPATNVVWVSATSLTCTTPAVSGPGVLGVTVINRDGQAGSLANAFTYT